MRCSEKWEDFCRFCGNAGTDFWWQQLLRTVPMTTDAEAREGSPSFIFLSDILVPQAHLTKDPWLRRGRVSRDDAAFITTRTQQAEDTTGREEHHTASYRYDSHILKSNIFSGLTLTGLNKPFYNLDRTICLLRGDLLHCVCGSRGGLTSCLEAPDRSPVTAKQTRRLTVIRSKAAILK